MLLTRILLFSLLSCLLLPVSINAQSEEKKVAIIIDDFGNKMKGSEEILALPIPLTIAVMPFLETSKSDAEWAHRLGHDVIIHLPMEPVKGKRHWLGPGAITTDLSSEEIRKRVNDAIKDVPYAIGINNHMGSKVTADKRVMTVILEECREHGLIYIDSKTTPKSVVASLAQEIGVPYLENELFFDDVYTTQHIINQTKRLIKRLQGSDDEIVAIGHVGPPGEKTAGVIKEFIPVIQTNAKFVKAATLIDERQFIQ
ncbi:divergent polysaccharide deacetylase family protein [Bacillus pinisoli]|uniref:divergent polysaccharide deacetylase family protein n=1 Tax=Bacillus pinisoli TaxID=2901866 RepID=UPI001FF10834|nr:divergent polysaccharide deacetylase family protein [Bacillus pinisoli]